MSNSNLAQSGWQTTGIFGGVAIVAILLTVFGGLGGAPDVIEDIGKRGELYFQDFDSTKAVSLTVTAVNSETANLMEFEVRRNSEQQWVIPSHHNYPADAQDRLGRTAASVMGMKRGALVTRWPEDHATYGVVDPREDSVDISDLEGVGSRVTIDLEGKSESVVDIIIGNSVEGQPSDYYVRHPEEDEVYITTLTSVDISAKFGDWINADLLELQGTNLNRVVVYDYEVDESQGVLSETELSVLTREDSAADWQLEGLEDEALEVDSDALTEIVSALDNFEIAGVRPKQEGLTADLALNMQLILDQPPQQRNQFAQGLVQNINRDLLRSGFRLQPGQSGEPEDISLLALQGELEAGTNEGIVYRLYFGRAFAGSQSELEIGLSAEEETAGETEAEESAATAEDSESEDAGDDEAEDVEGLDTPLELEPNTGDGEEDETEIDPNNQPGRYVFVRVSFDESLLGGRPEEPVEPEKPQSLKEPEGPKPEATEESDESEAADPPAEESPEDTPQEDAEGCEGETGNPDESEKDPSANEAPEAPEKPAADSADEPAEDATEKEEPTETVEDPALELEAVKLQYERDLNAYQIAKQSYATELANYERKLEEGKEKADDLNRRFALWYYVVPGAQFDKLSLSRPQLIREKSDEPETPAAPGGPPGGLPGGLNLPPGLNLPQ